MRSFQLLITSVLSLLAASSINAQNETEGTLYLFPESVSFGAALQVLSQTGMHSSGSYFVNNVGFAPAVWSLDSGVSLLEEATQSGGRVNGISDDGTIAAGVFFARAYRWVVGGSGALLVNEEGNSFLGEVSVVSGNGEVLAGTRNDGAGNNVPFVWTEADGISSLPMIDGYINASINGISTDGSVIAGSISNSFAESIAAIWTDGAIQTINAPDANFVRVIDLSPDGSKALIGTGGIFVSPAFIYNVATEERTTLIAGDFVSSFTQSTDFSPSDGYVVMVRRNLGTPQIRRDTAFALEVDASGTVVEETNFETFIVELFDFDPETTRINQVRSVRGDERFIAGDISLDSDRFSYVLDLDGTQGVVNLFIPGTVSQATRLVELIENATVSNDWIEDSWFTPFFIGFYADTQWIYSDSLEWLYVPEIPDLTEGFWFYSQKYQQWIYASENNAPWIYLATDDSWQLMS